MKTDSDSIDRGIYIGKPLKNPKETMITVPYEHYRYMELEIERLQGALIKLWHEKKGGTDIE